MKRPLLIIAICLLLGAAGCVVAAWSCALFFSPRVTRTIQYYDGPTVVRHPPANIEHGWPFHSLTSEVPTHGGYVVITAIAFGDEVLPMWPLWFGFVIDTLIYATVFWFLLRGPLVLRRLLRVRRHRCPDCGYPLGASPMCTECGRPHLRSTEPANRSLHPPTRPLRGPDRIERGPSSLARRLRLTR